MAAIEAKLGIKTQNEKDLIISIDNLLTKGQFFIAQDLSQSAIEQFPDNIEFKKLKARALLEAGALEEARALIEPLSSHSLLDRDLLLNTVNKLSGFFESFKDFDKNAPKWETLKGSAELSIALAQTGEMAQNALSVDIESLSLLAHIYKNIWLRSQKDEHFQRLHKTYHQAYQQSPQLSLGVQAAISSFVSGEKEKALDILRESLDKTSLTQENASDYCLASLLMGDQMMAEKAIKLKSSFYEKNFSERTKMRREIKLLEKYKIKIPSIVQDILKPPVIVGFTGHMIDAPNRSAPRFPAFIEPQVKIKMQEVLSDIKAEIGYSLGASGGDIIFLETMLERGGEINMIMPFATHDFIEASIRFAGNSWVTRFNHLLKLTHNLIFATEENYLGDDDLFQFAGLLLFGDSILRAQTLEAEPYLLALWDGKQSGLVGGTSDLINKWDNKETLKIIDLSKIRENTTPPKYSSIVHEYKPELVINEKRRVIKTMLFSDVVGFSKLQEHHVPGFIAFMQDVAKHLFDSSQNPSFINTWGDAIFAVLDDAQSMATYALALKEALHKAGFKDYGLPTKLSLRIGLHAGPVYEDKDPITGRVNYYGGHVNRAARIEPVTVPGRVYASEQFISLLASEEAGLQLRAKEKGEHIDFPWMYEYVGTMSLAKKFGEQKIYHLTEREI
ncbi:MAG: adenylate/guanylate cyclase domain-containing protein [Alphaproteobacteria bacterium]|nr:adenylate/guanylate cyclase domain-containing protein [Alphaproteobacteria bacterium]